MDKVRMNYKKFYNQIKYRTNVFEWYPFKMNSSLLYIGDSPILIDFFEGKFDLTVSEISEIDSIKNTLFNYVVIDGVFDVLDKKKESLSKVLSMMYPMGEIIILANNRLALRYFAGVKEFESDDFFGHLKRTNLLYSKHQWESLFKDLSLNYKFYYPYPDYLLTTQVLSDAWLTSNINLQFEDYHSFRYELFNENEALQSLIDSGDFSVFSNSFMIVISNKQSDIVYSKISTERKDEFKICTNIVKKIEGYIVEKVALTEKGIQHFNEINEFYKNSQKQNEKWFKYCPVRRIDNKLIFDFIDGQNLESLVDLYVKNNDFDKVFKTMDLLYEIISDGIIEGFNVNEEFLNVFGNHDFELLSNEKSIRFCDIDIILENVVLTKNKKFYILDYEWVFDCTVPISFILYRAILHSMAISKLPSEQIDKLYKRYGISTELRGLYLSMEEHFQNYVSDKKISDYYTQLNSQVIELSKEQNREFLDIFVKQNINIEKNTLFNSKQIHFEQEVNDCDIIIQLGKKAIFKINDIKINDNLISNFQTNASFVINNDYYFLEIPQIQISNREKGLLKMNFYLFYYGEDCINDIINLIEMNHNLNKELYELKKSKIYRLTKNKF
mgnify:FL=1